MHVLKRVGRFAVGMARRRSRAPDDRAVFTGPGVVLTYAGVANGQSERFRAQMEWLRENAIVQSLWDIATTENAVSDRARVAIAFDGAFDSVFRNAIPVLGELGLPATVFAVSGNLGRAPRWDLTKNDPAEHEIVMTVGQLSSLRRELFEVGSNTETHPHIDRLTPERIRAELLNSKNDLSAALARTVRMLSIPHRAWNPDIPDIARALGYVVVVTGNSGAETPGAQPIVVRRVVVSADDAVREIETKLRGAFRGTRRRSPNQTLHTRTTPTQTGQPERTAEHASV